MIEILWGIVRGAIALLEVLLPVWELPTRRSYSAYRADLPPGEIPLSRREWRAAVRSGHLDRPK